MIWVSERYCYKTTRPTPPEVRSMQCSMIAERSAKVKKRINRVAGEEKKRRENKIELGLGSERPAARDRPTWRWRARANKRAKLLKSLRRGGAAARCAAQAQEKTAAALREGTKGGKGRRSACITFLPNTKYACGAVQCASPELSAGTYVRRGRLTLRSFLLSFRYWSLACTLDRFLQNEQKCIAALGRSLS